MAKGHMPAQVNDRVPCTSIKCSGLEHLATMILRFDAWNWNILLCAELFMFLLSTLDFVRGCGRASILLVRWLR